MTRIAWAAYALVVAWVGWARVWPVQDWVTTSFGGYWVVARAVLDHIPVIDLYDSAVLHTRMQAEGIGLTDEMIGPPSLTLTLVPLAALPYEVARRVWLWGVCLPALAVGFAFAGRRAGPRVAPLVATVFLLSAPATENLLVGQVYPVFLLLHLLALRGVERGESAIAGLSVAPMMAMRGWYGLPLVAGWAASGRWRAAVAGVVGAGVLVLASVPWVGIDAWMYFAMKHLEQMSANPWAGATGYQTVRSLGLHLTTEGPWAGTSALSAPWLARPLVAAISIAIGLFAWRLVRTCRYPAHNVAALTCVELLLSPFTQEYHFVLAAIPAGVVLGSPSLLARGLSVGALALLLPAWDFQAPALADGWWAVAAYPRLLGSGLLFAGVWSASRGAC